MRTPVAIILIILCLGAAGCGKDRNRWTEADAKAAAAAPPPSASAIDGGILGERRADRIMLFAPTAVGPLAAVYPEARLDFPESMAEKVDVLMREYDGRVGESLPASDAPRWDEGRVAATAGVHVVVLTRILELRLHKGQPGVVARPDRIEAIAEVRALNVDGKTVWRKRAGAEAEVPTSPKTISAAARPESRAAYDALDAGLGALRGWLATQSDLVERAQPAGEEVKPVAATLVEVEIDSEPAHADVLIDGLFRGSTPQKLKLPPRALTVRIERAGYQPWERQITAQSGMRIQPALQPLAALAPPPAALPVTPETPVAPAAPEAPAAPISDPQPLPR